MRLQTAHTAGLSQSDLLAIRDLLAEVFGKAFGEDDWEHTLGGLHALAWEGDDELVGHAAVIQRRFLHQGRALRTGYIESVAVRPDRQRHGLGALLMGALEQVLRGAYELGALSSSPAARTFYAGRNWKLWSGPLSALTPRGLEEVTCEREIYVFLCEGPSQIDPTFELTCDWRDGDLW